MKPNLVNKVKEVIANALRNISPDRKYQTILELLSKNGEMYGLDIIEQSKGFLKMGSVYVYLARLEKKCLIISRLEHLENKTEGQKPRRLYKLTDFGEIYLISNPGRQYANNKF